MMEEEHYYISSSLNEYIANDMFRREIYWSIVVYMQNVHIYKGERHISLSLYLSISLSLYLSISSSLFLSLYLFLSLSLSLSIYIYCHPQKDCFVVSQLLRVGSRYDQNPADFTSVEYFTPKRLSLSALKKGIFKNNFLSKRYRQPEVLSFWDELLRFSSYGNRQIPH